MSTTIIQIVDNGANCKYKLSPSTNMLGRRYDNNADFIQVQFPEIEIQSGTTCTMMVEDLQGNVLDHIEVKNNELTPIYNNISQNISINIGFYFSGDNNYIKNSEYQLFRFCDALKPDGFVPVTPVQSGNIDKLIQQGVIDVRWKEGTNNVLEIVRLDSKNNTELELSPFVQEQSDLAETDTSSETFVKNKSTKYLENEGEDGSSPYATEKYVDEHSAPVDAVLYTPQTLTEEQQAQARTNIGVTGGEPIAEAIRDNTVQIVRQTGSSKSFKAGGANTNSRIDSIAIGDDALGTGGNNPIAIGKNAIAQGNNTIGLGYNARAQAENAIQLGAGTNSTANSFKVNDDNIYKTNTHTLTVQNIEQEGNPVLGVLSGETDPTTETVGKLFQVYVNTSTGTVWQCIKITDGVYTWVTLYDNKLLIKGTGNASSNCDYAVVIGAKARASHGGDTDNAPIVIGYDASTYNQTNGIAIGRKAIASSGGYAIGANASATNFGSISIGPSSNSYYGVSIGSSTKSSNGISIGSGAANGTDPDTGYSASCIQLLAGTNNHSNTLQIKNDNIYNYNSHTLTVQNIEQNGTPVYGILSGNADPTTETAGVVSQFYLNTTSKKLWQCVATTTQYILNPINNETPGFRGEWNFISNSTNYVGMLWMAGELRYFKTLPLDTSAYDQAYTIEYNEADEMVVNWTNEAYKTITTNEPIPDNDDLKNYLSQHSTQSVIYEWQSVGDETLAKQIQDNTTQIVPTNGGLAIGGANKPVYETSIAIGKNADTGSSGVAIGHKAVAANGLVALGRQAVAAGDESIAIGYNTKASATKSIIIDPSVLNQNINSTPNSFQIASDNIYKFDTHTLTVQNAQINGNNVYGVLQGETDPVETTVGAVGQFYLNTASKALWQCVAITTTTDATTYTWQELGGAINLYRQHYWFDDSNGKRHAFDILTKTTTQIISDIASLKKYLNDNGYSSSTIILPFTMSTPSGAGNINYYTGIYSSSDILYATGIGLNITTDSGTVTNVSFQTTSSAISFSTLHFTGYETITDTVVTV